MIYCELPWDSSFFHVPIASITMDSTDSPEELDATMKASSATCFYLMFPHPLPAGFSDVLLQHDAKCFDWKTTFRKEQLSQTAIICDIHRLHAPQEDCFRLAVLSGWKSRFFLDLKFRSYQPALYRCWVENYFRDERAGVWECRSPDGELAGMMCASCGESTGKLGLIAVNPLFQGKGIGVQLMRTAENFYLDHNISTAEVVTQFDNIGACRLYAKCGYRIERIVEVWHVWSDN